MRRHVASRRGDGLACASLQLRSPGDGASPAPHGCCTPPGPLTCVGPPCPPGDAFTLLLLSSSFPRVLLFCFSSHVLLNERGESRGWPRGWGRVDVAVVASHPNRAQVTHSQPCVPDAGWRHPVLRALLIPVGDKAARTGPDPAPLEDVRSPDQGWLSWQQCAQARSCTCAGEELQEAPNLFQPRVLSLFPLQRCQRAAQAASRGCQKCRQSALGGRCVKSLTDKRWGN